MTVSSSSRVSSSQGGSPLAPPWLTFPEDMNALRPVEWAHDVVRQSTGELSVAGLPVSQLAAEYGTPLFVVSEADFRARARGFRDAFSAAFERIGTTVDVYYASKAFLCTEVARWMVEEGLNIDVCSGGELLLAQRAGVPGERIGLHGNNKSPAELQRALDLGLGRIVVDSLSEIELLEELAAQRGVQAPVMLRLTPGVHAETHEFIATAHEDQKFGLSIRNAPQQDSSPAEIAVQQVQAAAHLNLIGVHCHIGSQIFDADGFAEAARRLLQFMAEMRSRYGIQLAELDLGGGYGIAYTEAQDPADVTVLAESLADVVSQGCTELGLEVPAISIEPGRAIAGPSTFTLYSVGAVKAVTVALEGSEASDPENGAAELAQRRYISVDGGMSDNPRPVLYDADYTAVLASRYSEAEPVLSRVVGKHCESGDIVVRSVYLPEDTGYGDLLAVPGTGAYCWTLASNYNYLPRPAVVAVRDGAARVIIRGETEEDLLSRDPGAS